MTLTRPRAEDPYQSFPEVLAFAVTSPEVQDGAVLPDSAVGSKGNMSPTLEWAGVPEGTKSFAVTCFDPDAPTPSGFWHWLAVDIPPDTRSLPADAGSGDDALPGGAFHVRNDVGRRAFDGAGPPEGDEPHRYYFVVHAVSEEHLGVDADASPAVVSFNLAFKTLGRAILVGTYQA